MSHGGIETPLKKWLTHFSRQICLQEAERRKEKGTDEDFSHNWCQVKTKNDVQLF